MEAVCNVCICIYCLRPNKKIHVLRVTRPYINLLVKPRIFSGFLGKNIILCILKGKLPFKMHKIIYIFPEKKITKKINVCLPYLKFQTRYPKHSYFFIWPYPQRHLVIKMKEKMFVLRSSRIMNIDKAVGISSRKSPLNVL